MVLREQSPSSDSIILVVSANGVEPSELSVNSLTDVELSSSASSVRGGLLSIFGKLNSRSTSLKSLSVIVKCITDVVASDDLTGDDDFCD